MVSPVSPIINTRDQTRRNMSQARYSSIIVFHLRRPRQIVSITENLLASEIWSIVDTSKVVDRNPWTQLAVIIGLRWSIINDATIKPQLNPSFSFLFGSSLHIAQ